MKLVAVEEFQLSVGKFVAGNFVERLVAVNLAGIVAAMIAEL